MSAIFDAGGYKRITATTQITTYPAVIVTIVTASTSAGTYQIYDSATGTTTTPITGVITPAAGSSLSIRIGASVGIYIVVTGTLDATIVFI